MSKKFLSGINVIGGTTLNGVTDAGVDTDKFIVLDSNGVIKYRTGDEILSDVGAVSSARTLSINGTSYDLSADRSWTISTSSSARSIQKFVATAGQTTFTITGGYTVGLVDVYVNGVKLDNSGDFTATNGSTIVLTTGTLVNNIVEVYKYINAFTANNALRVSTLFTATAGQTTFTATYSLGLIDVFYNGSKLSTSEYNASSGTSIVLNNACSVNDIIEIIAYNYSVGGFTGVSQTRTLTINGTAYDLGADRAWTIDNASLGAQPQLNGTGLVRMAGTTVSYDNATYATQSYVTTAVANLVNAAPSTLDTLNELATALGNDANFSTTVTTSIGTKQPQLNGTGFVKISGTTISYDNSTYLTTSSATSTYLPLAGGTLTGALNGTSATFSGAVGIGANPSQPLTINQAVTAVNQGIPATTGTNQKGILRLQPSIGTYGETLDFGMNVSPTYAWIQSTNASALNTNYSLVLNPNGGNIGIGVIPSNLFQTKDVGITNTNSYFGTGQVRIGGGSDHTTNTVLSVAPGVVSFDAPGVGGGRFTINSSGNIGFGIASPASSYGFTRFLVISNPTNAEISLEATTSGKVLSMGVTNGWNYFQTTTGNGYDFQIGGTSRFVISSTGAISTSSTISAGGNISMAQFSANAGFAGYTGDGLFNASSRYCSISTPGAADRIRFGYNDYGSGQYWGRIGFAATTNWSLGIITGAGNDFSIGTGYQGQQFYIYANGNYDFTGSDVSDRRKKTNINYITSNQLDNILKLKPVTFNKIAGESIGENIHTGFIAQDIMEEGIPNLVMGSDEGGYGLDYNGILALAVKAIQELKAEIDILKAR